MKFLKFTKRDRILLLLVAIVALLMRYHRPLHLEGYTDPGDYEFRIQPSALPSAWTQINSYYSNFDRNKSLSSALQSIEILDGELGKDRKNFSESKRSLVKKGEPMDFQYFVYGESGDDHIIKTDTLWNNIETLFAGQTGEVVQQEITTLGNFVQGHDLATNDFDYYSMIPRVTHLQALYRVASVYSANLCRQGAIAKCRDNYLILFDAAQKFKRSGALISMLIGVVMEDIMIEQLEELKTDTSKDYSSLFIALSQVPYQDVREVLTIVMKSEYQALKTIIEDLPQQYIFGLYGHTIFDELYGSRSDSNDFEFGGLMSRAKALHLPFSWFLNVPETLHTARVWYTQKIASDGVDIDSEMVLETIWPQPAWSRSNIVGYSILNAVLPRMTGVSQRAKDTQERFASLVGR